jgi:hypothetical protein
MEFMNTAHFVKTLQPNKSSHQDLGLPPDSRHGLVLGKLFKLHPDFDEVLFSILLESQAAAVDPPWYLLFISERNHDLNRLVYQRWKEKQRKICCGSDEDEDDVNDQKGKSKGTKNPLRTSPCCHYFSFCEIKLRSNATTEGEHDLLLTQERCQNFVLHRLRFVNYARYLDALFSSSLVLDTFPYGGQCLSPLPRHFHL